MKMVDREQLCMVSIEMLFSHFVKVCVNSIRTVLASAVDRRC